MIVRTILGLGITCLIGLIVWCALSRMAPEVQAANGMLGERWYQLFLADNPVGYYRSSSRRHADGRFEFDTELRFALAAGQPVTVKDTYAFAARPPFALAEASHTVVRNGKPAGVAIARTPKTLISQRSGGVGDDAPPQPVSWDYSLEDYLAFELWLQQEQPGAGATVTVRSPNLETLEMSDEAFELLSSDTDGYQIRKRSLLDATVIELNPQLIPTRFKLAGVFDLTLSSREVALASRTTLRKASYRLPLDQPLRNHEALTQLELAVQGADAEQFPRRLLLTANPLVTPTQDSYLGASLDHPVDHPKLQQALTALELDGLSKQAQVYRLLNHVHRLVRYDDSVPSKPVLELLEDPVGDCTEYADLFTTLARAAGIPARTVIGMAYSEDPDPSLAFHAWNQVRVDSTWQAVDPTWNQRQVDATHWPLPGSERQAMLLLTGQVDVALKVVRTGYDALPTRLAL